MLYKSLFYLSLASFIIATILYILSLFYYPAIKTLQTGLFYFIPFLLIILVYYFIRISLHPNFLAFAKVLSAILNIFIIGILQVILSFCVIFVIENDYEEAISKDIKAYSRLLKSASEFETKHFPQIIPPESKNIKAYKSPDSFFGSERIILSFEIDKEYIENELEKYKFIVIKGPYLTDNEYKDNTERYYAVNDIDLNKAGFKFYAIGKGSGEYGIAVNDKTNRILYYSITLD